MSRYQRGLASPGAGGCSTAAAGSCRGTGESGWVFPHLADGRVSALGNLDPDGIVASGGQIIMLERAPQSPGFEAHHGIGLRIEAVVAIEDLGRDRIALQPVGAAGQHLLHYVAEKAPAAFAGFKAGTVQDPLQLLTYRFRREYARIIGVKDVVSCAVLLRFGVILTIAGRPDRAFPDLMPLSRA